MKAADSGDDKVAAADDAPGRPDWARPVMPPEMLAQPGVGVSILQRVSHWPRLPQSAPDELIVRCSASYLELRVNNIFPVGVFSLFFGGFLAPLLAASSVWLISFGVSRISLDATWITSAFFLAGGITLAVLALCFYAIYRLDYRGDAGENLTIIDRLNRKVYRRAHKSVSKGEWNWDDLHPYTDRRNAISRVNEALLLVELDPSLQRLQSVVQIQVGGMDREPLLHTYSFIKEFMQNGVTKLPPIQLAGKPEPAWYSGMPPWFLWLPRSLAQSIWAFFFLLFTWPIVVWARLLRRVLPYSRWPADFETRLKADEAQGTPAEKAWLAANVKPPESLPWTARLAFAAAVVVSAPYWWAAVRYYVGSLAKFVGL